MKIAKVFSIIFAVLGSVLLLGTMVLSLLSMNAPVRLLDLPEAAVQCGQDLMDALEEGDYAAAAAVMYGQPDLGVDHLPSDEAGTMVWEAFLDSMVCEFTGECYATDSGIARNARITTMNIDTVMASLKERVHILLQARIDAAKEMSELYDEENNFREDLVNEILYQAVEQALEENVDTVSYDVTLRMIHRDGQWWVVPDQALLKAISGGVA